MADHQFVVGSKVVLKRGGGYKEGAATYALDEVEKVHKTGRFVLKGDRFQQWTVRRGETSKAYQSGQHWSFGSPDCHLLTPALEAEMAAVAVAAARRRRVEVAYDGIRKLFAKGGVTDEQLAAIEALVAGV